MSLRENEAEIMIGALDDAPADLLPEYEIWIGRREPWLMPVHRAEQFHKDREPNPVSDLQAGPKGCSEEV